MSLHNNVSRRTNIVKQGEKCIILEIFVVVHIPGEEKGGPGVLNRCAGKTEI